MRLVAWAHKGKHVASLPYVMLVACAYKGKHIARPPYVRLFCFSILILKLIPDPCIFFNFKVIFHMPFQFGTEESAGCGQIHRDNSALVLNRHTIVDLGEGYRSF